MDHRSSQTCVNLGDRVDYNAPHPPVGRLVSDIVVSGNAQSCSCNYDNSDAPQKITQIDTFTFATPRRRVSVTPTRRTECKLSVSGNSVTITTVIPNEKCAHHSYSLDFRPDGIGTIWSMTHSATTTTTWPDGRSLSVSTYDTTLFP